LLIFKLIKVDIMIKKAGFGFLKTLFGFFVVI